MIMGGYTEMSTTHTFQTPCVKPLVVPREDLSPPVLLIRVAPADAERIVRALDETSLHMAHAPSGSRVATAYRRLAADIRTQADRGLVARPELRGDRAH
jgi:hypothetical protein